MWLVNLKMHPAPAGITATHTTGGVADRCILFMLCSELVASKSPALLVHVGGKCVTSWTLGRTFACIKHACDVECCLMINLTHDHTDDEWSIRHLQWLTSQCAVVQCIRYSLPKYHVSAWRSLVPIY